MKKFFKVSVTIICVLVLLISNAQAVDHTIEYTYEKDGYVYTNTIEMVGKDLGEFISTDDIYSSMLEEIEDGKANAHKQVYFESLEDAINGIVRVDLDVIGKPMSSPMDIGLVIDVSGSMTMAGRNSASACLNEDHYYKLDRTLFDIVDQDLYNNATTDVEGNVYFKFSDYDITFTSWSETVTKDICKTLGIELNSSFNINNSWQPWNKHYHLLEGEFEIIQSLPYERNNNKFHTPSLEIDNPNIHNQASDLGCYDRMMIMKDTIVEFIEDILSDDHNRIAITMYANNVRYSHDFTNDQDILIDLVRSAYGYDQTNYVAGLEAMEDFIDNRQEGADKPTYVMFLGDGDPYVTGYTQAELYEQAYASASNLKEKATVFTVGLVLGESELLKGMATSSKHYYDVQKGENLEEAIQTIRSNLFVFPTGILTDVIGGINDEFHYYIGDNHPTTIEGTSYTTFSDIPLEILSLSEDGREVIWNIGDISRVGHRLSFYLKLQDDYLYDSEADHSFVHTNITTENCEEGQSTSELKYQDIIIENDLPALNTEFQYVSLGTEVVMINTTSVEKIPAEDPKDEELPQQEPETPDELEETDQILTLGTDVTQTSDGTPLVLYLVLIIVSTTVIIVLNKREEE